MRRSEPLGLAALTGPQLHRHESRVQLAKPLGRKSLDSIHSPLPPRQPRPSLRKHALPIRVWKYPRKNDRQGVPPFGLLCWWVHCFPSAARPWNLPPGHRHAWCLGSHLHSRGMCDADEPAKILLSIYGTSRSRSDILLRLQSSHRHDPDTCQRVYLRPQHRIHRPYHRIHVGIPFGIAWSQRWKRNLLVTLGLFGIYLAILVILATFFGLNVPLGVL